jgi:hypothetical protein
MTGHGFYSEKFDKAQVQAAEKAGKVTSKGWFSIENGTCGLFARELADQNVVIPAVRYKLREYGANAARRVVAHESASNLLYGLLIIPGLIGCGSYIVEGEALSVDESILLSPQTSNAP